MFRAAKRLIKKTPFIKPYSWLKTIFQNSISSKSSNFDSNKKIWNKYASNWGRDRVFSEASDVQGETYIKYLGDEWGKVADVERIIEEYIYPFVAPESVVAELGSGGGRIASKVATRAKEFYCFDISLKMLERAKKALSNYSHVKYVLLNRSEFSKEFENKFDFVYSFDVFVHLDLHAMWKYFKEFAVILKDGGKAFIHTTNLRAPGGWEKFSEQEQYTVEGHYFISPEIVEIMAERSHLKIIKTSEVNPKNFYLNRDYLVVLEKFKL